MDNTVTVVGNLTREPELRYTPSGQAVCRLGIAVNRRWQNRQTNEWEEQVSFFNVTAWGQLGENVGECLGKGTRVIVTGRLEQRSWESPDGEKKSSVDIIADEIAPSLRWATAKIERNERKGGDFGDSGGGGGAQSQSRPVANQDSGYDEEPF